MIHSLPKNTRVLTIANQKGGVGKTTTAINLGTALAAVGERVMILDLDPQGNASTGLGIGRNARKLSTYDVITGRATLTEAVMDTNVPRLSIVPSTLDLLGVEMEISQASDRPFRVRNAAHQLDVERNDPSFPTVDYILIDCPPSLNLLTINAFAASHAVLVPLQCEFFALEGLGQLLSTVEEVKASVNPELAIHGIVLTMYDSRNNLSGQVVKDVRDYMGDKVYETIIPRNVRISEAPSHGKPALLYDFNCAGSQAYLKLASEIVKKEREIRQAA